MSILKWSKMIKDFLYPTKCFKAPFTLLLPAVVENVLLIYIYEISLSSFFPRNQIVFLVDFPKCCFIFIVYLDFDWVFWNVDWKEFDFRESVGDVAVFDVRKEFLGTKTNLFLRRSSATIERFVLSIFKVFFYIDNYKIFSNSFYSISTYYLFLF